MTLSALLLVLGGLVLLGAVSALAGAVIRGDGLIGPRHAHEPPRSHHPDVFETSLRRLL